MKDSANSVLADFFPLSLTDFLHQLKPELPRSYEPWDDDWEDTARRLSRYTGVLWYGGSGLDLEPVYGALFHALPSELIACLGPRPLFVYTDYGSRYIQELKYIHDHREDISNTEYGIKNRSIMWPGYYSQAKYRTSFTNVTLLRHQSYIQAKKPFYRPIDGDVPWRGAHMHLDLYVYYFDRQGPRYATADVLWLGTEVLETWERLFVPYNVKPNVFLTLRTGGKSGAWMDMRDPRGPLMTAVAETSKPELRPDYWVTDTTDRLEQVWDHNYIWMRDGNQKRWRKVFRTGRDGYGLPQTFRCDWPLLQEYCQANPR